MTNETIQIPAPPRVPHDMTTMLVRVTGTQHACPMVYDRDLVESLDGVTDIQELH